MANSSDNDWPELSYAAWADTAATLQLWTQIVGKIRLTHTPWLNHSWHVTLYVTSRGLSTSAIPNGVGSFEVQFDFIDHVLDIAKSDGERRRLPLRPHSVADFYSAVMAALTELKIPTVINQKPCEIPAAIPFAQDQIHAAYDPIYAHRFWRVLVQVDRVFKVFRTAFLGKSSPVHFFWGSFDLAVTRFSGRTAPAYTGAVPGLATEVMREAYSHEVSSAGFWPGGAATPYPAFYSYLYPVNPEFKDQPVAPAGAHFDATLGEFLLPYEAVRTADDPDAALIAFLQSTYEAAAVTAHWDRALLECSLGKPGVPRRT